MDLLVPAVAGKPYFITGDALAAMKVIPLDDSYLESLEMALLSQSCAATRGHIADLVAEARRAREAEAVMHEQLIASRTIQRTEDGCRECEHKLVRHAAVWLETMRDAGHEVSIPSDEDIKHSALLKRIRAGHQPLSSPPPTNYGYPWYDLYDSNDDHPVEVGLGHVEVNKLLINQCQWTIKECVDPKGEFVVAYGNRVETFRVWFSGQTGDSNRSWLLRRIH